jgi:WD40 repeat protein
LLVSPEVAALTSSLLKSTLAAKLKIALSVLLAVAVIGGSVAVAMYPSAPPPAETAQEPTESVRNDAKKLNAPDALGLIRTIEHGGELWFVVFSPDGKYLLTGGDDQTACLYETSTGQVITGPLAHTDTITAGAISSDNRTLITVAMDGTARIWDAGTGRPRGKVMRHRSKVNAVALSPDGTLVATASADGSAQLWVASTGAPLDIVLQHGAAITDVAFLPDGRTLLTSGWDGIVRQWNVAKGESVRRLLTEQRGVTAMSVSFDGRVLLTGSRDRGGQLWDIATGIPISAAFSVDRYFANIAFSPDSRTFLTGDFAKRGDGTALPGTVRLWETASVQPIGPAFVGEDGLAFHPNGRICATTGNSKVHLWDLRTRLAGIRGETADSVLSLWSELAGKDATRAFQAMDVLTTEPEKSVPFLEKQLLAAAVAEEESGRGPNAVPKGRGQVGPGRIGPEQLRLMRSVQVLEAIGSSSARDVLRKLGQGSPELALTRDARASLARLDSKP